MFFVVRECFKSKLPASFFRTHNPPGNILSVDISSNRCSHINVSMIFVFLQSQCIAALTRLSAVVSGIFPSKVVQRHCLRLLSGKFTNQITACDLIARFTCFSFPRPTG